jgi:agmatine deiminase
VDEADDSDAAFRSSPSDARSGLAARRPREGHHEAGGAVRLNARSLLPLALALGVAGCGRDGGQAPSFGYRESFGGIEVVALTPPEQFVGRVPLMLPERAEQELVDAGIRDQNPRFFAPTEPPPPGTRAIAEFEPVDAVHIAFDAATESFVAELLRAVLPVAPVIVTLTENQSRGRLEELLRRSGLGGRDLRVLGLQHDNFWTRDFGPLSVELPDGRPAFLDFRYPQTRVLDDGMPSALAEALGAPVFRVPLRLEGGVLMTNGQGLCVTTTTLAVQNSEIPLDALARQMNRALGCSRLVILESPGDEATGHVDMFAKFTSPDTVLVGAFDPALSPQEAARMDRNARLLEDVRVGFRRRLRVVRVPMPAPEGVVFPSYTNSLLVNGTAVVPTYGRGAAEEAAVIEAYERALPPGWRVVTVDASRVIGLGGAVHCAALELRFAGRSRPS